MKRKEKLNYYKKFVECAEYSIKCSNMLKVTLSNFKREDMDKKIEEIHKIENDADTSKHEMMRFLLKDFLPPIEREDIINLAHRIDNVTDFTEEILININIFNIEEILPNAMECTGLLIELCNKMKELLEEFENFGESKIIQKQIIEINGLEEQGDRLYARCMKELYVKDNDAIKILTWSNIFNGFESCFDACESVADYVESILMKNS